MAEQKFSAREKMQAAQREVNYRRWVYEKRVEAGKMTRAAAEREIAIMSEIATDYGSIASGELLL